MADQILHPFNRSGVVTDDFIDFIGEEIADRPFDKIGFAENAERGDLAIHGRLNFLPLFDEQSEIADEISGPLAFADSPDNNPHSLRNIEFLQNGA